MLISESFALVLFRLTNFILFGVLMVYLFHKYAWNSIKESMQQEEDVDVDLQKEIAILAQEKKDLEQKALEQKILCDQLEQRVLIWKKVLLEKQKEKEKIQQEVSIYMKKVLARKEANFKKESLLATVVPQALKEATESLKKKYSPVKEQKQYLDMLIKKIKRKASE